MRRLLVFLFLSTQAFGAFSYYRALTIDHTKCGSSDASNFPVLVSISHTTLKTVANGGHIQHTTTQANPPVTMPADLIFSADSSGSTRYPWEVESYDGTNGILVAWVRIPTVSHTLDTPFYLLYGDSATGTAQNSGSYSPANVWDANYKGVWHLPNGATLSGTDSTSTATTPVSLHSISAMSGRIGGGGSFNGSSNYIEYGNVLNLGANDLTISAWFNSSASTGNSQLIVAKSRSAVENGRYFFYLDSNGKLNADIIGNSNTDYHVISSSAYFDGNWHLGVFTVSRTGNASLYADGSAVATPVDVTAQAGAGVTLSTSDKLYVGVYNDSTGLGPQNGTYFKGLLDEVRISLGSARSASWILTEYNNQNAPGNIGADNFIKFGAETPASNTGTIRHKVTGGE